MRHLSLALAAMLALSVTPIHAALNDTGQTECYDASAVAPDCAVVAGDAGSHPRQDARFGRDPAFAAGQFTKTGTGAAGFDFTPFDDAGNEIALSNGIPTTPPACVRDNHTNLIWEVKTIGGLRDEEWTYSWYDGSNGSPDNGDFCFDSDRCDTDKYAEDVNTANLCGFNSGWRLPTRRELLSIVHHGASNPAIDTDFFPNTLSSWYWSSDDYAFGPTSAWWVDFSYGVALPEEKTELLRVRLVRSGQ